MNLTSVLAGLQKVIDTGQSVAGPLAAMGVPYAGVAKALLDTAENLKNRIDEGAVVATSDDRAQVAKIIEDLQADNDRLNAEIEKS